MNKSSSEKTTSQQQAEKHIDISIMAKELINNKNQGNKVFIASYANKNLYYQKYQEKMKKEKGEKFFGIRLYSGEPCQKNEVKRPDIAVSKKDKTIEFIIEVKWGGTDDSRRTDLKDFESDLDNMNKFDSDELWKCCIDGKKNSYDVNKDTRFVLLSDFDKAIQIQGEKKINQILNDIKLKIESLNIKFEFADIYKHTRDIPSFEEIINSDVMNPTRGRNLGIYTK